LFIHQIADGIEFRVGDGHHVFGHITLCQSSSIG
jgi:hypothetical protein